MMIDVGFHEIDEDTARLVYVVMITFMDGQLVVVRHRDRRTWENPGGHIEPGETPDQAAARELVEETGAVEFSVTACCDYSVSRDGGKAGYGRLYRCDITEIGPLGPSEIAEVKMVDAMPDNLTYPDIQPYLVAHIQHM